MSRTRISEASGESPFSDFHLGDSGGHRFQYLERIHFERAFCAMMESHGGYAGGTFTVSATGVSLSAVVTTSDSEGSTAARRNDCTVARAPESSVIMVAILRVMSVYAVEVPA